MKSHPDYKRIKERIDVLGRLVSNLAIVPDRGQPALYGFPVSGQN